MICSTDPSLNLPLIPQEFIEEYCENPVEDVWVEFKEILGDESIIKIPFGESDLIPIITPIQEKESWTRKEVVELITKAIISVSPNPAKGYVETWIKENV